MSNGFFQAIGFIAGTLHRKDDKFFLEFQNRLISLFPRVDAQGKKTWRKLENSWLQHGEKSYPILVYVYPLLATESRKSTKLIFLLNSFSDDENKRPINTLILDSGEFILRGIWQYTKGIRKPVITVYRNYNAEKLKYFQHWKPERIEKHIEAHYVPISWKDPIVEPYRTGGEMPQYFLEVKAYLVGNSYEFSSMLALPTIDIPRYFKVSDFTDLVAA